VIEVEVQLRHEMQTVADGVKPESIRPLQVPPRRRSRTIRWLAPVAAAAAVAGLVIGVTVAGHNTGKLPNPQSLPAGAPKYYVTLNNLPQGGMKYVVYAVVRSSATGAPISSVPLLRSASFVQPLAITGAANDRAFLITIPGALEILRLAPDGHVMRLTRLPKAIWNLGVYGDATGGDVLSPEGTEVVMPIGLPGSCTSCGIAMVSVTTGVTKKWLLGKNDKDFFSPVNWPGNGNEVLVSDGIGGRYRLLDVAKPGGSLLASSHPIPWPGAYSAQLIKHDWIRDGPWLLPDEKTLLTGWVAFSNLPPPANTMASHATARVIETSASTGRLRRELYVVSRVPYYGGLACYPESLGPSGLHVLMWCLNSFGRLDGSHFTPLPGASNDLEVAIGAAW
jgi:hypothetical protein